MILSNPFPVKLFYFLLKFILILSEIQRSVSITRTNSISAQILSKVNAFENCAILTINFRGLNLNLLMLRHPIFLYHYFSPPTNYIRIYPIEMLKSNQSTLRKFYRTGRLMKYVSFLYSNKYRLANSRSLCEIELYIHPPSKTEKISLYGIFNGETTLLNMNWVYCNEIYDLIPTTLNTIPTYSVLVYNYSKATPGICNDSTCRAWISAVRRDVQHSLHFQQLHIWETSSGSVKSYMHCKYCDPCNPEIFISIYNTEKYNGEPWRASHIIYYTFKKMRTRNMFESRTNIVNYLRKLPVYGVEVAKLYDTHIISTIFGPNISNKFSHNFPSYESARKRQALYFSECGNVPVSYSANLLPGLERWPETNLAAYPHHSLGLSENTLKFVACHKELKPWIIQLQELVSPFGLSTWLLLLISLLVCSKFLVLKKNDVKSIAKTNYMDILFQMLVSLTDQSTACFQSDRSRKKVSVYFAIGALPLAIVVLNNHYKGDNIERLTVVQTMPFDVFDKVANTNFKVYTLPYHLSDYDFEILKDATKISNEYVKENGHEAYPIISQLLRDSTKHFYHTRRLHEYAKGVISERLWYYLNNTELFPQWRKASKWFNHTQALVIPHLRTCNKSAVILEENIARIAYSYIRIQTSNVYYGKDTIFENINGYKTFGQLTEKVIKRMRALPQMGIQLWWKQYWEFFLAQVSHSRKNMFSKDDETLENMDQNSNVENGSIYALCAIPSIGFVLSLLIFITTEFRFNENFKTFKNLCNIITCFAASRFHKVSEFFARGK